MSDPEYFCVQTFWRDGERIERHALKHYPCEGTARRAAKSPFQGASGAVAFAVHARPEHGIWGEPRLLAVFGDVPRTC